MSEYQYYEFQTLECSLTAEEKAQIKKLSSRVQLSGKRAIFVYSYGDFPADEKEILEKYFDALFYIANWGTIQLMFRFPKKSIDLPQIKAYCSKEVKEFLNISVGKEHLILTMTVEQEDSFGWLEGEGYLDSLIGLRDEILQQDYRCLYLMYLKAMSELMEVDQSILEPPIPQGLNQLSPALEAFIELFKIEEKLIKIASQSSQNLKERSDQDLQKAIQKLTRLECDEILFQLAKGETAVKAILYQKLSKNFLSQDKIQEKRSVKSLLKEAENQRIQEQLKQKQEAEAQRIKALEKLAQNEQELWQEVDKLIVTGTSKSYDSAISLLKELYQLAVYQNKVTFFNSQIEQIRQKYRRRSGLLHRLETGGFLS